MNFVNNINIKFLSPEYFRLIPIFFLLFLYFIKINKIGIKFYCLEDILQIYQKNNFLYYFNLSLLFIILILFTIISANPNLVNAQQKISKKGLDIVLVLDISYSMSAEDFQPNRLEAAKSTLHNFASKIENDRLGLVVFAGKPFVSIPLTFDYNIINETVDTLQLDTINQNIRGLNGTAIGDAILIANNLLKEKEKDKETDNSNENKREKIIILLTDGEANVGLDPIVAAQYAADKQLKIYTIGIGGTGGNVSAPNMFGQIIRQQVAGVDEKTLQQISSLTQAKYYRATDNQTLKNIFQEFASLNKSPVEIQTTQNYLPISNIFIYILIGLLNIFFFLQAIYKVIG